VTNSSLFYVLLALAAGLCLPTQAGINAQLNLWARSPVLTAAISFAVGTAVLVVYALLQRLSLPPLAEAAGRPWWIWTGGALGAFFVAVAVVLVPRLGATTMLALILAGQMGGSLLLDHFGLLGYPLHPVSAGRLLGVALLAAGVVLIRLF
jgi:transporter family-2 protein